jgi:hypothetical protein
LLNAPIKFIRIAVYPRVPEDGLALEGQILANLLYLDKPFGEGLYVN